MLDIYKEEIEAEISEIEFDKDKIYVWEFKNNNMTYEELEKIKKEMYPLLPRGTILIANSDFQINEWDEKSREVLKKLEVGKKTTWLGRLKEKIMDIW